MTIDISSNVFTEEELSIILEAAWFAMQNHYEEMAVHLDIDDSYLEPMVAKINEVLNPE
jgi:hypothetical protein